MGRGRAGADPCCLRSDHLNTLNTLEMHLTFYFINLIGAVGYIHFVVKEGGVGVGVNLKHIFLDTRWRQN